MITNFTTFKLTIVSNEMQKIGRKILVAKEKNLKGITHKFSESYMKAHVLPALVTSGQIWPSNTVFFSMFTYGSSKITAKYSHIGSILGKTVSSKTRRKLERCTCMGLFDQQIIQTMDEQKEILVRKC